MNKQELRQSLVKARKNLPNKLQCMDALTDAIRIWLVGRTATSVGAYWPIKGEFDPLPALHRWKEDGELIGLPQPRRIGLPVVNKVSKTLAFHVWYPGCEMEEDAYNIPKPKDTDILHPSVLFVPCVGFTKKGGKAYRLGYGGGFYDRTLANLTPAPITIGLAFECARCEFEVEPHDMPLDAVLTEHSMA